MPTPSTVLDRPAIRPLEVQTVERDDETGVVLIDRLGSSEPTFVPAALLPILGRCTGEWTLPQIRRAAQAQFGHDLTEAFLRDLVQQLDERLLLVGPRFDAALTAAADGFLRPGVRPPSHSGSAGCPAEPTALRMALGGIVRSTGPVVAPTAPLRGLVAPHIDLQRGADGYRAAYERLLAAPPADLYVVFGTGHGGPSAPLTGLPLDWQTPLGTVETDRGFVAAVHSAIGGPQPEDLLLHRTEHSLEFQMLFLQHLHERRGGGRPFQVAGFLCGTLPSASGDPLQEEWMQRLLAAFRTAERLAEKGVCYIAGADLAHIGPQFGDEAPVDEARLAALAAAERQRLRWLQQGAPGAFHAAVDCGHNPDRVCSAPAITLCATLAGGRGELLHYGQARADDGSQAVSFCAVGFAG
jgi:AmmeMemoRadiSam system protein B